MRLIELPVDGRLATSISIALPAGSRHERPDEVGAAHLLEHMVFKGTVGQPTARDLNRAAERLGTELNAETGSDHVAFYAVVRAESAMAVTELLADLCGRPLLDPAQLDGERSVVLQEIADADEDPATAADDRLAVAVFAGHRLGQRITGRAADVERLTAADLDGFRARQWSPAQGAAIFGGNLDHVDRARVAELLERIPSRPPPPSPPPVAPFARRVEVEPRDSEVAHLRLAYSIADFDLAVLADRAASHVFSVLIGGPLGSRLADELREERGLCYAVDGWVWGYPGFSALAVDLSLPAGRVAEAYELIEAIVADLRRHGPTAEEAERAGAYALGVATLTFDSIGGRVAHALEAVMDFGDEDFDPLGYMRRVAAISRADLAELAARIVAGPCVGCAGPVDAGVFGATADGVSGIGPRPGGRGRGPAAASRNAGRPGG